MLCASEPFLPPTMLGSLRNWRPLALDRPCTAGGVVGLGARNSASLELLCVDNRGTFVGLLHSLPLNGVFIGLAARNVVIRWTDTLFNLFLPDQSPI